ncbi:poly(ADP-ribose) glycohydrolase-like [Lissotriton helveticus]
MAKRNNSSGVAGCLNQEDISDHSDETEHSKNTFSKSSDSNDLIDLSDSNEEKTKVNSSNMRQNQGRKTSESDGDSHQKLQRSLSKSGDQGEDSKEPLGSKTEKPNREVPDFMSSDNRVLDKKLQGADGYLYEDNRSKVKGPDPDYLRKEKDGQFPDGSHREKIPMDMGAHHSRTKEEVLPTRSPVGPLDNGERCLGVNIDLLKKIDPARPMPQLRPSFDHVVLVEVSTVGAGFVPTPYKGRPADPWNQDFVKMPHSQHNLYESNLSFSGTKWRWNVITKALRKKMSCAHDIEKAIKSYNKKYERQWKFDALDSFFTSLKDGERQYYLTSVIPKMAELALQLPIICPKPIPMLKKGQQRAITMSQQQVACLLCNAFFCTFPRRNATQGNSEYATYPSINFNRLFDEENSSKREKLRAIFCYFAQVVDEMRTGLVTYERRKLAYEPKKWSKSQAKFTKFHVSSEGTIEENGKRMLQVDFASPIVGGGVLGSGLVQEEIRFLINTELIVSRLFTEKLDNDECLLITGAEQYSRYAGYCRNFKWTESMKDSTPRDAWQRRCIEIVAIDAIRFRDTREQFTGASIDRDLNKAYCGFQVNPSFSQQNAAVATGNWGCGAFNGHPKMKGLLQLMAAAEARRDVAYFTFGDHAMMRELHEMHLFLEDHFTVGQLYTCLKKCCKSKEWKMMSSFYDELKSKLEISKM